MNETASRSAIASRRVQKLKRAENAGTRRCEQDGVLSAELRNAVGRRYFFAARMRRTEVRPIWSRRAMAALATPEFDTNY